MILNPCIWPIPGKAIQSIETIMGLVKLFGFFRGSNPPEKGPFTKPNNPFGSTLTQIIGRINNNFAFCSQKLENQKILLKANLKNPSNNFNSSGNNSRNEAQIITWEFQNCGPFFSGIQLINKISRITSFC